MVKIEVSGVTLEEALQQLRDMAKPAEAKEAKPAEAKPAEAKPAEAKPAKPAKPKKRGKSVSYESDVKPLLIKLASSHDKGREKAAAIVHSFTDENGDTVRKGDQIPESDLAEAKAKAEKALEADDLA